MGRSFPRLGGVLVGVLVLCSCATEQAEAPTFRVTAPPHEVTTTTEPGRLAWIGEIDLSAAERDLCAYVGSLDATLSAVVEQNRAAERATAVAAEDRTLSEPIRVRMIRDTELANARRLAGVFAGFSEGIGLLERIDPTEKWSADRLAAVGADIRLVVEIGNRLQATIAELEPLDPAEQAAYAERTGTEWRDLFTEAELDRFQAELDDEDTGLGLVDDAREAMDRIDDWSWRGCSQGFSD